MAKYSNQLRLVELALLQKDEIPYSLPLIIEWELKSGLWFNYDNKFSDSEYSQVKGIVPSSSWVDLTSKLDIDGKLNWQVLASNWKVIRMGYTLTGAVNEPATVAGRGLECDKLDKRGIEPSFAGYIAKMAGQNSAYVGKGLNMVLIDSYEAGPQNWIKILPDEFLKRRGSDIHPWLPLLVGETVNSVEESERFLWDYRITLADLFADNLLGQMQALFNKTGLKFVSEATNSECTSMCDAINYTSRIDIPMNKFWDKPEPKLKMVYLYVPDGTFKDVIL